MCLGLSSSTRFEAFSGPRDTAIPLLKFSPASQLMIQKIDCHFHTAKTTCSRPGRNDQDTFPGVFSVEIPPVIRAHHLPPEAKNSNSAEYGVRIRDFTETAGRREL
jgi:hypothetical protein